MQWPGDDALDFWPETDSRRPTAFWIYQKICARELELGRRPPSKNSVFEHYEHVLKCLAPRFIIDPSLFSHSMVSLLFSDDLFLSEEQFVQLQKIPNVEEVQRGMGLWQPGLFRTLALNVLYREEEELEKVIERVACVSDAFKLSYRAKSFMFSPKKGSELPSLRNSDGTLRSTVREIVEALVEPPLIPLNDLSKKTGIKRDRVYRNYSSLANSGLFKIEYSVT